MRGCVVVAIWIVSGSEAGFGSVSAGDGFCGVQRAGREVTEAG